jgi:hypothetical protein
MKNRTHEKRHFHTDRTRAQVPLRVAARLEGVVKNRGTKPKKKPKKEKK